MRALAVRARLALAPISLRSVADLRPLHAENAFLVGDQLEHLRRLHRVSTTDVEDELEGFLVVTARA